MNVLVVDDDVTITRLLGAALTVEEGVDDIRVVHRGSDALDVCVAFHPDVIILDYWMPGMDGAEAAGRIREVCPDARIVAFSGVLEGKPEWADAYYPKGDLPDIETIIRLP
ncbi:MAG TPA: response regulator [Actinomycetota bacterium]|nr:response regulator [Actinomycetota bacterium]